MNDDASAESDPETIAFSNVHWVCSRKTTTAAAFATIEASTWSNCCASTSCGRGDVDNRGLWARRRVSSSRALLCRRSQCRRPAHNTPSRGRSATRRRHKQVAEAHIATVSGVRHVRVAMKEAQSSTILRLVSGRTRWRKTDHAHLPAAAHHRLAAPRVHQHHGGAARRQLQPSPRSPRSQTTRSPQRTAGTAPSTAGQGSAHVQVDRPVPSSADGSSPSWRQRSPRSGNSRRGRCAGSPGRKSGGRSHAPPPTFSTSANACRRRRRAPPLMLLLSGKVTSIGAASASAATAAPAPPSSCTDISTTAETEGGRRRRHPRGGGDAGVGGTAQYATSTSAADASSSTPASATPPGRTTDTRPRRRPRPPRATPPRNRAAAHRHVATAHRDRAGAGGTLRVVVVAAAAAAAAAVVAEDEFRHRQPGRRPRR